MKIYPFSKELVESKMFLSIQFYNEKNNDTARIVAKEVIDLVEKKAPEMATDSMLLDTYKVLAELHISEPDKCIEYRLKVLACTKKGSEKYFDNVRSLLFDYYNHSKLEELKALLADLEKLLNSQKDDKLDKYWIIVYYGKAQLYKKTRNYEQAVLYSKKLFADNEIYELFPTYRLAPMYMEMGIYLTFLNEYDEAIEWAKKGTQSTRYKSGGQLGTYYSTLGYIYGLQKKYKESIEAYEKGIPMFEEDSITFKAWLINAYNNIANWQISLKEYDNVIESIEKSKKYGSMPTQNYYLGSSFGEQGKYEMAVKEFQQVLIQYSTQFKDENIDKNPSTYEVFKSVHITNNALFKKGEFEYKWGKEQQDKHRLLKSYETLKIAFSHYERVARASKGFDKSRFLINESLLSTLAYMIMVQSELYELEPTPATFDELLYLTERRKALQLIETLSPSSLPESLVKQEQVLLKELNENGQKLDLATYNNQKDSIIFYRNALIETNQVLENHFETIKKDYPKTSINFYNNEYATLQDNQNNLSKNTALIEYNNLGNNKGFAITISSTTQKIVAIDLSTLSTNIKKLNELIQDRFAFQKPVRDEFIEVSHQLYNQLIKPIESEIAGKTKLMIVLEGQLFHLPFELLLKSNEKKPYHELDFLIKNYEVNYHYSATSFLKLQEKQTVKR